VAVTDKHEFNRQVRRAAVMTGALGFALLFGILVLAGGDWIPGGITVAAALVGLAREIPRIRKLCTGPTRGGGDDDHDLFRASGRGA
jgi:hypothetical protein